MPSQSVRPGSLKWTCGSMPPGKTCSPPASISVSAVICRCGPMAAIRPSMTATSYALATSFGSTTVPLRRIRSASAIRFGGAVIGLGAPAVRLGKIVQVIAEPPERLVELPSRESLEDPLMLVVESGQARRRNTLGDLGLQPDVVDKCLQPAQHFVATHSAQRGLECQVEARLLDGVGELALALLECTPKQAEVGGATPFERSPKHLELDRDSCGQDLAQQHSVEGQPAHELPYSDAMAGVLDIGPRPLLGSHSPKAFQDLDRLADEGAAHLERGGKLAVAGQPVARFQAIAFDVLVNPMQHLAEDVHALDRGQVGRVPGHRVQPPLR